MFGVHKVNGKLNLASGLVFHLENFVYFGSLHSFHSPNPKFCVTHCCNLGLRNGPAFLGALVVLVACGNKICMSLIAMISRYYVAI